jgi:hypothetical protein
MKLKYKILYFYIACCIIFVFSSCGSISTLLKQPLKGYLSISVTEYNNGINTDNGMTTHYYCYDLTTSKTTMIKDIPYTSQYPLGVYDRADNTLYYSAQVIDKKSGKGDQLFSCNLKTGKIKQLSNDIFAINYIIPTKDKIITVAAPKGMRQNKVAYYDRKSGKFIYANKKDDFNTELMSYNPFTGKLLATNYYMKQMDDAMYKSNVDQTKITMPNYYIYDYTDIDKPKLLFTTKNMMINRIASSNQGDILYTQADDFPELYPKYYTYFYNPKTSKAKPVENIASQLQLSNFLFYNDDKNQTLFIGVSPSDDTKYPRGIYSYDLKTKELKLLFTSKTGFINNFTMLAS